MCAITGFWFRQSVPNLEVILNLFRSGNIRGTDGFGMISYTDKGFSKSCTKFNTVNYDNYIEEQYNKCSIGDIIMSNHRAAPETEKAVDLINLQPIISENICVAHNGAISNFLYKELYNTINKKSNKTFGLERSTDIDSEAIIWCYLKNSKDMKDCAHELTGGFSFSLIDSDLNKLFLVSSHNPLYLGYVRGYGMFWASTKDIIFDTISKLKNTPIDRNNICVWEDYYFREFPAYTINEIDLDSGMINESKFEPRYIHPNFDVLKDGNTFSSKERVIVSCSGGLDSTTTLCALKYAGYECFPVYFHYGHRGDDCEYKAIKTICDKLNLPLLDYNLDIVQQIDNGILTDNKKDIQTGTEQYTKSTYAWTIFRNHFFMTTMGALAERMILDNKWDRIYITGGFLQLSESGSYPDNTERFVKAGLDFFKYSITGTRIHPLYGLCNLLKWEQLALLKELGLLDLTRYCISCDRPRMIEGLPCNCALVNEKGNLEPACGSGRRSWYSTHLAGVTDLKQYYILNKDELKDYTPYSITNKNLSPINYDINTIIDKLYIGNYNKSILKGKVNEKKHV